MAQEETIFREIPKNQSEIIRISRSVHNGYTGINIRVWYIDEETEKYLPTRKGVWIPLGLAPEVSNALLEALDQMGQEVTAAVKARETAARSREAAKNAVTVEATT